MSFFKGSLLIGPKNLLEKLMRIKIFLYQKNENHKVMTGLGFNEWVK
jgi:hypothetical protein